MKLSGFVRETLVQIVSGVVETQGYELVKDSSAAIAPCCQQM